MLYQDFWGTIADHHHGKEYLPIMILMNRQADQKIYDHSQWIVCVALSNLTYWSAFLVTSCSRSVKASLISADSIRQCMRPPGRTMLLNTKYFNYIGISNEAICNKQKANTVCSLAGSLRPPIQGEPESGSLVQTDSLGLSVWFQGLSRTVKPTQINHSSMLNTPGFG